MSYRGRLLIALKTDISDSIDTAPSEVETMPTQTINEVCNLEQGTVKLGNMVHLMGSNEAKITIFQCHVHVQGMN